MTPSKTVVKVHKGSTYVFIPEKGRGFKVSKKGSSIYWYQKNTSVVDAKKKYDSL